MKYATALVVLLGCSDAADNQEPDAPPGAQYPALDAMPGEWSWIEFPGSQCGNGTPAGIGVNWQPGATSLVIYLQGGGACFDDDSCFVQPSAINMDTTYTAAQFAAERPFIDPFMSRGGTEPWAQSHFIYVPYCTGDLHTGTTERNFATQTAYFMGGANMQQYVAALAAGAPDLNQIWLVGSSAGGYGAGFNLHRFRDTWPEARVDLLQDASPFVQPSFSPDLLASIWQSALIPGCETCTQSFDDMMTTLPSDRTRAALLSRTEDETIRYFFFQGGPMGAALDELVTQFYGTPNANAFIVSGTQHTFLQSYATYASGGTVLKDWIRLWATGDAAWTSVGPN